MGATCSKNRAWSLNRETAVNGVCLASQPSFVNCEVSGVQKISKFHLSTQQEKAAELSRFHFFLAGDLKISMFWRDILHPRTMF